MWTSLRKLRLAHIPTASTTVTAHDSLRVTHKSANGLVNVTFNISSQGFSQSEKNLSRSCVRNAEMISQAEVCQHSSLKEKK